MSLANELTVVVFVYCMHTDDTNPGVIERTLWPFDTILTVLTGPGIPTLKKPQITKSNYKKALSIVALLELFNQLLIIINHRPSTRYRSTVKGFISQCFTFLTNEIIRLKYSNNSFVKRF